MPRKPNPTAPAIPDTVDRSKVAEAVQALNAVAPRSREVAERFGDGQPYDRHRLVSEARFFMSNAAEAMLELGKRLIQIKENEPHGEFMHIVEHELGLNPRSAQKVMAAAVKFLSPRLAANASALTLLGKAKLFDLMQEDEGDIEALAEGGSLAGMTLDDMAAMTSRELRDALVDARKKIAAKDKVIAGKESKISQLEERIHARESPEPDQAEQAQLEDLRHASLMAESSILALAHQVDLVMTTPANPNCELAARQSIDWIVQRLAQVCLERSITVDLAERVRPLWAAPIDAAVSEFEASGAPRVGRRGKAKANGSARGEH